MASGELKGHFDVAVAKDLSGKESTSAVSTGDGDGIQITCFTEDLNDVTFHFQIIRLEKQNNAVSVASILGGASDNTGSSIARRIVLKTGLNVILACNIPKNSPMLEADAERKLMEKLKELGYTRSRSQGSVLSNS
ncbi:PREDICTED: uncharacterized protein LOC104610569 isoform X2 [Nelumbo nucifera]|uniref:Proteasome assembly chaperone 4 n=2 Tax=Nelumbo nucifera TaxID=4432 RepID=A0A822YRZ4_NELNU|nr:PREDICTED: uncharacterized protein LOC104610569 isoform X2 [Nelumbo nucifera]DAD33815.1 TPA_asm: hypothetical protein HUJ06_012666 [Nelumbo nucifera]